MGLMIDNSDVGAPYTLGQAQNHISQGPLGRRITWVQQSPLDYLSSLFLSSSNSSPTSTSAFDAAVLAHSLWYFSTPSLIQSTFRALRQHSKRLLVAEWSLLATHPLAQPHVLAMLAGNPRASPMYALCWRRSGLPSWRWLLGGIWRARRACRAEKS
jgi:hypothetical protein